MLHALPFISHNTTEKSVMDENVHKVLGHVTIELWLVLCLHSRKAH